MPPPKKEKNPLYKSNKDYAYEQWKKSLPENLREESPYYNLRGAWEAGLEPEMFYKDEEGNFRTAHKPHPFNPKYEPHLSSRNPYTGEILKDPRHDTYDMAIEGDIKMGYHPTIDLKTGKMYSISPNDSPTKGPFKNFYANGGSSIEAKKDATLVVGNQPKPSFKENKKNPVKDISKDVLPLPGFRDKPEDTELIKLIKERQIKPRGPKQPYELASGAVTPTASPIDAAVVGAAGIPQLVGRGVAGALPYLDAPLTVGSKVLPSVTANNLLNAAQAAYSGEQIINPESDLRTNPNAENILMTGLGLVGLPYKAAGLSFADDLGQVGKYLTEETALKNAYKINPWAEKLVNPSKSYRVAGMDAARDFEAKRVLRSNPAIVKADLSEGILGTRTTPFPSFQKGYADLRYLPEEGGVIFETDLPTFKRGEINPFTGKQIKGSHYAHRVIDPTTGKVLTEIPSENVRMFGSKPHWLRGYKPIKVSKPTTNSNSVAPVINTAKNLEDLNAAENIPKNFNELSKTGFKDDPYYHYQRFLDKKEEITKAINTPEGRKRIQGYIDKNPHLQNKTVDDIISDFEKTTFETERPYYRHINDKGNVEYQPWFEKQIEDAISKGQLDESYRYHPDPAKTQTGWIKEKDDYFSFDVDPENAYNWYKRGYDNPSYISMGQNYTPYDAMHILEHEFAHLFQRGNEIKGVDDVLGLINLKNNKDLVTKTFKNFFNQYNPFAKKVQDAGYSVTGNIYGTSVNNPNRFNNLKSQKEYWLNGAERGQEKAAFAAEIRENLLQRGILKNRYDEITPEMLKEHFKLYHNTEKDKYNLRLYDIMKNDKKNFDFLSYALNRMPAVIPPAAIIGAAASQKQEYKYGGNIPMKLNKYNYGGNMYPNGGNTLYVDNPNDPRLQAYNDSLYSYNITKKYEGKFPVVSNEIADKITGLKTTPDLMGHMPIGWYKKPSDNPTLPFSTFSPKYKKPVQPVEYQNLYKMLPIRRTIDNNSNNIIDSVLRSTQEVTTPKVFVDEYTNYNNPNIPKGRIKYGKGKTEEFAYGGNIYFPYGGASILTQSNLETGEAQAKENTVLDKDKKTRDTKPVISNPSLYSGKQKQVDTAGTISNIGSDISKEVNKYTYKPISTTPINYNLPNSIKMDTSTAAPPITSSDQLGLGPELNLDNKTNTFSESLAPEIKTDIQAPTIENPSTTGKTSSFGSKAASNAGGSTATALNIGNQIYNATKNVDDRYNQDLAGNEKYNKEYSQAQEKYKEDQSIVDTTATTLGTIGTVMSAIPVVNAFSWIPALLAAGTKAIGDPIVDADYENNAREASLRNFNMASPEEYNRSMKVSNKNILAPESNQARYGGKMFSYGGNIYANGGMTMYNMPKGLTHEQHPYGGYPIGNNNYVESDEVVLDKPDGSKYIFSNRIKYKI